MFVLRIQIIGENSSNQEQVKFIAFLEFRFPFESQFRALF